LTPAIKLLNKLQIKFTVHEYLHDPNTHSFGEEAAELLGVPFNRVFKTLVARVISARQPFAVAVVPVDRQLNLKLLAKSLAAKKTEMADPEDAERLTGYLLGGISPLGQKRRLPVVVDESALQFSSIYVSAGRRGLEVELTANDLVKVTSAQISGIC
jgi:Cys-tRNA(Pro)/Cys-tRNA(Cys) deacylase